MASLLLRVLGLRLKLVLLLSIALGLAIPLYVVPNAMGDLFVQSRLSLTYLSVEVPVPDPTFRVLRGDGTVVDVTGIAFSVHVDNSYFLPVVIGYRAPELLLLVYSEKVDNPGDDSANPKLVWRATGSADVSDEDNVRFTSTEELTEHAVSVPPQGLRFEFADDSTTWNGVDTWTSRLASPGVYYVYSIAFGRLTPYTTVNIVG